MTGYEFKRKFVVPSKPTIALDFASIVTSQGHQKYFSNRIVDIPETIILSNFLLAVITYIMTSQQDIEIAKLLTIRSLLYILITTSTCWTQINI